MRLSWKLMDAYYGEWGGGEVQGGVRGVEVRNGGNGRWESVGEEE